MMFELLLDVMDRFLNLRDRHSNHRIGAHTCTNQPYPTGRLFWGALFQALRARLRSHRPSGTSRVSRVRTGGGDTQFDAPGLSLRGDARFVAALPEGGQGIERQIMLFTPFDDGG